MKLEYINIEEAFDLIENIAPSDNWDLLFEKKLQNARTLKSNKISKINIVVLILVFINVGFILNSFRIDSSKLEVSRKNDFKIIANELLN